MQKTIDLIQPRLQVIREHIMRWSAKNPGLALCIVILSCTVLLPFITVTALMPIVLLVDLGDFIRTKGIISTVYTVIFQGLVLGMMLVVIFFAAFAIATSASVLHSYNYFYKIKKYE